MPERIAFSTTDEVKIIGDWMAAPTTFGAVVLLHMMPATRGSWAVFQGLLAERGLASLAIDLRGHGESTEGPGGVALDYKLFTDDEHQSSILDAVGAYDWIRRRGFEPARIAVAGASIGANLAVQLLLENPACSGAALLSPGKNYRGTNAAEDAENILPHQALWVAASEGDDQKSFEDSKDMDAKAPSTRKIFVPLKNAGHGTAMLTSRPDVAQGLADWLKETIQGA